MRGKNRTITSNQREVPSRWPCLSKLTLVIVTISFSLNLSAQMKQFYQRNLPDYTEYLSKEYGIICGIPERFTELDKYYVLWKVREQKDKHTGGLYGPVFQSRDKGCLLMYAALPQYVSEDDAELFKSADMIERIVNKDTPTSESIVPPNRNFPRGQILAEIKTALGLYYRPGHPSNNKSVNIDLKDYVTIISGKKAHEMFNADTIYIYNIPSADSVYFLDSSLEKIRKRKYPFCTGVFISKDGRATMYFKFFFTERSREKEEKYINMLDKQVWYD